MLHYDIETESRNNMFVMTKVRTKQLNKCKVGEKQWMEKEEQERKEKK